MKTRGCVRDGPRGLVGRADIEPRGLAPLVHWAANPRGILDAHFVRAE